MKPSTKRLILFATCILHFIFCIPYSYAQAPQAMPYQAVARDNAGNLIANQNIALRFSIRDSSASGTVVYKETQNLTTNSLGLFSANIGLGTVVSGLFAVINWGSNAKFLQVELDAAGGSNYISMGTQQMMSVPYALLAGNSGINPPAAYQNNSPALINDNTCTGVTSILSLSGLNTAVSSTTISVTVNITHTFDSDLRGYLIAPNGAILNLFFSNGSSGDNFINTVFTDAGATFLPTGIGTGAPFTNSYKPTGNLTTVCTITPTVSTFAQLGGGVINPNGTWTLRIVDQVGGDNGFLNNWSININGIASHGTANYVPKWQNASLTNTSLIYDDGTHVGIAMDTPAVTLDVRGNIRGTDYAGTGNRPVFADSTGKLVMADAWTGGAITATANLPIPDGTCTGSISNVITLSGLPTSVPSDRIKVTVNINHNTVSQLRIYLLAPNGNFLNLLYNGGNNGNNLTNTVFSDGGATTIPNDSTLAPFTGVYKPSGVNLATCATPNVFSFGQIGGGKINPNGNWTIKVIDLTSGSTGTFVSWSISVNGNTTLGVNNYLPKWNFGTLTDSSTIFDNGNVGIGTTSPTSKLEVTGSIKGYDSYLGSPTGAYGISIGSSGGGYGSLGYGLTYTGTTGSYQYRNSDFSSMLQFNSGGFDFNTSPIGIAGNTINYTTAMKILQNGNVGIGTGTPGGLLDVFNGTDHTTFIGDQIRFSRSTGPSYVAATNVGGYLDFVTNGRPTSTDSSNLVLSPNLTSYFNGNVGIGANIPAAKLDVAGTAKIGTNGSVLTSVIKGSPSTASLVIAANTTALQIYTVTNVVTGSSVMVSPASALNAGLVIAYARISAANTVEVSYRNTTASSVTLSAAITLYITVIQ